MAVPIRFAVELLKRAGWKSPEEMQKNAEQSQIASNGTNSNSQPN
jgi:hypothetical protein